MIALGLLLMQGGYTLGYAAFTGDCWQDPWAYVARALGSDVKCSGVPTGLENITAAILGFVAWKALFGATGSALSRIIGGGPGGGGGGGGGEGQTPPEENPTPPEDVTVPPIEVPPVEAVPTSYLTPATSPSGYGVSGGTIV